MKFHVWEVTLYKNVGTKENPVYEWVTDKRFYRGEKKITDEDLYEIPNKRKDVKFIGVIEK